MQKYLLHSLAYIFLTLQNIACNSAVTKSDDEEPLHQNSVPQQYNEPPQRPSFKDVLRENCTIALEKNERLHGTIFSQDCREVGKSPGIVKDFFNAKPGVSAEGLSFLSSKYLRVDKTKKSSTRIDATLIPISHRGTPFANFIDFNLYAQDDKNNDHLVSIFRRIRETIDLIGLDFYGYRLIAEEKEGLPFHFRLVGGEPLGNTVQLAGKRESSDEPSVDLNQTYSEDNSFKSYLNGTAEQKYTEHKAGHFKSLAFKASSPKAAVHMIVIPAGHYVSSYDFAKKANADEIKAMLQGIATIISENETIGTGPFRLITNAGWDANQSVPHFHIHIVRGGNHFGPLGALAIPKNPNRKIKTYNINELLSHVAPPTLAVFDIDATVLWAPGNTWPYPNVATVSPAEGQKTIYMWQDLLKMTSDGTLDPSAKFIFLTARGPNDEARQNLIDAGLVGYKTNWIDGQFDPTTYYKNGILYASLTNKGEVFIKFWTNAKQKCPWLKDILFIDDRLENITNFYNKVSIQDDIETSISFWYQGAINPATHQIIGINYMHAPTNP